MKGKPDIAVYRASVHIPSETSIASHVGYQARLVVQELCDAYDGAAALIDAQQVVIDAARAYVTCYGEDADTIEAFLALVDALRALGEGASA